MEEIIREEGGSQFTLQALFKELKKKLLLVVAIVLLCTAIGGVYGGVIVDTKYTSNATMIVNVGKEGTLVEAQGLATALKSIADPENDAIYEATATTFLSTHPDFANKYKMNKDILAANLKGAISVTTNQMLLNLKITSTFPEADSILNQFMTEIQKFANQPSTDGEFRYPLFADKVFIVSPASKPFSDAKTKVFKYMLLFFVVGVFGSMLLVLLSVLLNDTYADKLSFEKDYNLDVLATFEDVTLNEESRKTAKEVE
ncbi:MAG: hypothetical protein IKA99_01235 [Clostridia bacterium]|nr:hypothetical protein [Clostridia bacterium]